MRPFYHWWHQYRSNRPQRFNLTMEIGPWPQDQIMAIPYPVTHQQQIVQNLQYQTDGQITDHHGCLMISAGTQATVQATLEIKPFRRILPGTDYSWQPIGLADHAYTTADRFIHSNDPEIRATAERLKPAGTPNTLEILEQLYQHTLQRLTYGNPIPGLYTSLEAMRLGCVDCGGFSTYLGALAQASGIPSRIVAGFWAGYHHNEMHAWVEALLPDGTWWPMDASVEWMRARSRSHKHGGFGHIGSDRVVISVGTNHVLRWQNQEYPVGMLQLPMILNADGTVTHQQDITNILTARL